MAKNCKNFCLFIRLLVSEMPLISCDNNNLSAERTEVKIIVTVYCLSNSNSNPSLPLSSLAKFHTFLDLYLFFTYIHFFPNSFVND